MAYLDYSLPDTIDLTPGVKAVGDALSEVMKRRQERQQFEETQKLQREQEDRRHEQMVRTDNYNRAALDERTNRDRVRFMMEQDANLAKGMEGVRTAPNAQTAKARAAALRRYDWKGNEIGVGQLTPGDLPADVGPEPKLGPKPEMGPEMQEALPDILQLAPGMPPELAAMMRGRGPKPVQPMEGPIPTAEEARRGAMGRVPVKAGMFGPAAMVDPSGPQSPEEEARLADVETQRVEMESAQRSFNPEFAAYQADERAGGDRLRAAAGAQERLREKTEDYEEDARALPGRKRAYAAKASAAESRRPYTVKVGADDPGVTFDFETQRYAEGKEGAERFLAGLPVTMDDKSRQAAQVVAGYIASNQIKPHEGGAMLQRVLAQNTGEAGKDRRSTAEIEGRADVARINLQRPIVGQGNVDRRFNFEFDKEKSKLLRTDIGNFIKTYKARTIGDDQMAMGQIEADLKSNIPGRQRQAMIQLWQVAQHDHRVSNQDAILAQDIDPSFLALARNYVSKKTRGTLDPAVQAQALNAAKTMSQYINNKATRMREVANRRFIDSGLYDPREANEVIGQQIPGWEDRFNADGTPVGGEPELPAAAPPEVRAGKKGKTKRSAGALEAAVTEQ